MSTNQQNKNNEEEIDLGSLFLIIGRGFSKLSNFIGSIFKGLFHFFITVLIFFKENSLKIGGAAFLGFVLGMALQFNRPEKFSSELLLKPNFKSTRQLYNNVNYYNDLVKQKDTIAIQKTFGLNSEYAASLKKFEIEPLVNETDIVNAYDELILEVDTLTIKSYEYADFKNSFTDYDYNVHKVTVVAEKNDVFHKLDEVIISSVIKNKYFNRVKELTNENLNRTDSLYRQNLAQIDSLRKVYMTVMIEEAKKESAGTSIDLGGTKKSTKELELFETNRKINYSLAEIAENKSEQYEVINVISNFQPIGYEVKGITKNYAFLVCVLFGAFMTIILLLLKLNIYLNNYKK